MSEERNARIAAKADEILGNAREMLGPGHTAETLHQAVLFDAAWSRALVDDQQAELQGMFKKLEAYSAALQSSERIMRDLLTLTRDMQAKLQESGAEHMHDMHDMRARLEEQHTDAQRIHDALLPLAQRGEGWTEEQRRKGFRRWEDDQAKHENWKRWQADAIAENPKFADHSKAEQARRLKKKHGIPDDVDTIRKRLSKKIGT